MVLLKNIILVAIYYLKENIEMGKNIKEKNITVIRNLFLKVNIKMEEDGVEMGENIIGEEN